MMSFSPRTLGFLLAAASTAFAAGCSDSSNDGTPGTGGTGGPDPSFMAMLPCSTEAAYVTTPTTITFGGADPGFNYSPKCLKVTAGSSVTFSGDFSMHPLIASESRGTLTGNPIPPLASAMNTGTTASFTFPTAGFYAYLCQFHGSDTQEFMNGVIWVK